MHVAIIGAGPSGLAAAKNSLQNGFSCEVFERNEDIGGTWYYTDDTGTDKYNYPVYASMYSNLKTNLPKEVMAYSDYKYPAQDRSYLKQEEVLAFFKKYANDHNLLNHIKLLSPVIEVLPLPNNRWSLKILHLPTKKETVKEFDAIMICSGHFNEGIFPNISGRDVFKGEQIHSHEYRKSKPFSGKKVLVIGAGPSGLDIALVLATVAKSVILSHHNQYVSSKFPSSVTIKPDVTQFTQNGANFADGTNAEIDCIIYCTGYKYKYPFLHKNCKIIIEDDKYIKPLYQHMINIEFPTMCFIGIPYRACSMPMYDLQIRFYMEYLKGSMKLPTKENMYNETAADIARRKSAGLTLKQFHLLNKEFVWDYYKRLADSAKIENIWPAIIKLRIEGARQFVENVMTFRNDKYKIVDKENFVKLT